MIARVRDLWTTDDWHMARTQGWCLVNICGDMEICLDKSVKVFTDDNEAADWVTESAMDGNRLCMRALILSGRKLGEIIYMPDILLR